MSEFKQYLRESLRLHEAIGIPGPGVIAPMILPLIKPDGGQEAEPEVPQNDPPVEVMPWWQDPGAKDGRPHLPTDFPEDGEGTWVIGEGFGYYMYTFTMNGRTYTIYFDPVTQTWSTYPPGRKPQFDFDPPLQTFPPDPTDIV
tara:strand:+ start:285 stop:713 length:429 start_codon:yes stop_codon:yes gene_type:complete